MDNDVKMYSQVAAAAGVTDQDAMVACYMLGLSQAGKTLDEAATLLRVTRPVARRHARSWSIRFPDYPAAAAPVELTWTKEKRGRWVLLDGGREVAQAVSDGTGSGWYDATIIGFPTKYGGSSAEIAIARCSDAIEQSCVHLLGVEDVSIIGPKKGDFVRVAPTDIGDRTTLARALHS